MVAGKKLDDVKKTFDGNLLYPGTMDMKKEICYKIKNKIRLPHPGQAAIVIKLQFEFKNGFVNEIFAIDLKCQT
jgi:hypothetical protein